MCATACCIKQACQQALLTTQAGHAHTGCRRGLLLTHAQQRLEQGSAAATQLPQRRRRRAAPMHPLCISQGSSEELPRNKADRNNKHNNLHGSALAHARSHVCTRPLQKQKKQQSQSTHQPAGNAARRCTQLEDARPGACNRCIVQSLPRHHARRCIGMQLGRLPQLKAAKRAAGCT